MSKYIDLLREHQESDGKKKPKKKKSDKAGKPADATQNPYRNQEENDNDLIESVAELIDEQHSLEEHPNIADAYEDDELIASEDGKAEPQQPSFSKPNNELGFDTSDWLQHVEQTLVSMFSSVQNNQPINIPVLEEHLTTLFDQVQSSSALLDDLEFSVQKHNRDNINAYNHADLVAQSLARMVYTIKTGLQLQKTLPELLPTVTTAMLHHIGFATIPSEERVGLSPFSDTAKEQVKQATQFAIEYLENHHISHEQLSITLAQSGEQYDGKGAQGLEGRDIAWVARLTMAVSSFEALTSIYASDRMLPRDAIRYIVKNHKRAFDSQMIKAIIDGVSLYPVAIFIQLNTGEIGQVINVHPQSPLRPIVYISMDKHGHPINERNIDLQKQPNIMIQKCMFEPTLNGEEEAIDA